MNKPRKRTVYMTLGALCVLFLLLRTDPFNGGATLGWFVNLATGVLVVFAAHYSRKALFDYPAANMCLLFEKAKEQSTGAGLAILGLCVVLAALLMMFATVSKAAAVPTNALTYLPVLKAEQKAYWPAHPQPYLLAGLVEQESCIRLTSPRCWSPASRLKTSREEGAGFGQITRAYTKTGQLRFDSLAEMRKQHSELKDWSWENVYSRPDLQLRAVVLMNLTNYVAIKRSVGEGELLAFTDAAYNGGLPGLNSDIRICYLTRGCDPHKWFGHVERTCSKSKKALYGQRSACDINREHVRNVMLIRSEKYRSFFV